MLQTLLDQIQANLNGLNQLCGTNLVLDLEPRMVKEDYKQMLPQLGFAIENSGCLDQLLDQVQAVKRVAGATSNIMYETDVSHEDDYTYNAFNFYTWTTREIKETPQQILIRVRIEINNTCKCMGGIFSEITLKAQLLDLVNKYLKIREVLQSHES
jgi:hypothetical protein